ncbi:MAG TPA: NUDIX hydrolase [Afifellaceae bacterium]|nr:NUDIX hydrolase [Afifellaceae bacterium]
MRQGSTAGAPQPQVVARRIVFEGWSRIEVVTVEWTRPDGKTERHDREVVDHGMPAAVLPVDCGRGLALLTRQWRAAKHEAVGDGWMYEAAAGFIDEGESPEAAAIREAKEELGVRLREVRKVGSVMPASGVLTETLHLFLADYAATDCVGDGGGAAGEGELIEVVEMPIEELFAMARAGRIDDAKTLILVQALMLEGGGS